MKFKKGDIVKIRKDCTLEELDANYSNGCRIGTFKFLENSAYRDNTTYKIQYVFEDDSKCVKIEDDLVNVCCLELVRRNKNKKFKNARNNKNKDLQKMEISEFINLLTKGDKK